MIMKTQSKVILLGTVCFAIYMLISFPHGDRTFLIGFAALCGGLVWAALTFGKRKHALPDGFSPSYRSTHIALDLDHNQLWLRPIRGNERVLYRSDLRTWQHEWKEASNIWGHVFKRNNRLVFNFADVQAPTAEVHFTSYQDAATWQARINAWANG
jgi:hypothetical protein